MAAFFQYLLINVKEVALEKASFNTTQNPNTLTVDDKIYLLNRHNLTQPIQMQLSKKQKNYF